MKQIYDREVFNEEFILKWYNRKSKLDKNSALKDKKAEKKFKELIEGFINWLE